MAKDFYAITCEDCGHSGWSVHQYPVGHTIKGKACSECGETLRYGTAVELINLSAAATKKKKRRPRSARKYPVGSARAELAIIAAGCDRGPTICRHKVHSGKIR